MSTTPTKINSREQDYKTPKKQNAAKTKTPKSKSLKAVENLMHHETNTESSASNSAADEPFEVLVEDTDEENTLDTSKTCRRSGRTISPNKRYAGDFVLDSGGGRSSNRKRQSNARTEVTDDEEEDTDFAIDTVAKPKAGDLQLLEDEVELAGKEMFGFNTPKKKGGMALAAMNTPKMPTTPKTPKTPGRLGKTPDGKRAKKTLEPKTPSRVRNKVKNQIAKLVEAASGSDFSGDESDFAPSGSESSSSDSDSSGDDNEADDEPKTPCKGRKPIVVPVLPKTPSAARLRQSSRVKKNADYVPECESYFQSHSSSKILTSDHTLDRLKNPRLPADRLFSLLAEMKLSSEHESSINAIMEEYKSYFPKWLYILNEGYNILLYGLGSKRQLLQSFHRIVLSQQCVLVINGFFPSLTVKDILDSITNDILDAGISPGNPHEAVDMIEEEFALIPQTHLYLIVHNLDGSMLRNSKAQSILARLAKVPNIHMLASVDHINTPLLWDHTKLSHFNFSWWDCTTMLPYSDETAFENSLLVQNSGDLALSSLRSVFLSLTTNSRGIYMIIVKHQLKNKGNANYQGMHFKDLYWSCREAFLVSSDLALRAQLTEFLDHKLVKSKRSVDGSEQLTIPIDAGLLQQFLDEQEKKV
ncbi:origin recognition complex subunit 2 [Lucilia cuprina]|uniref:origin recognition complex subunit 2 n=1 Tax=Lucilia cuprina TaxID=7375 RepID=UPI001F0688DE|nr:origin recognition complex subunit 2 [Lucilia cuprina]XP_046804244.1 origin recognition complex subunit 2 [Lucilia cuprina]XP_046804245.1 origin recognition complex subunit 2 [Lucilia cuprina]